MHVKLGATQTSCLIFKTWCLYTFKNVKSKATVSASAKIFDSYSGRNRAIPTLLTSYTMPKIWSVAEPEPEGP